MAAPVVILSPHLDDAVLSCWHVLSGPADVRVINLFAGLPALGAAPGWWDRRTEPRAMVPAELGGSGRAGGDAAGGTWMIVEPNAGDRVEDNLNPIGRVFYGASTVICDRPPRWIRRSGWRSGRRRARRVSPR